MRRNEHTTDVFNPVAHSKLGFAVVVVVVVVLSSIGQSAVRVVYDVRIFHDD